VVLEICPIGHLHVNATWKSLHSEKFSVSCNVDIGRCSSPVQLNGVDAQEPFRQCGGCAAYTYRQDKLCTCVATHTRCQFQLVSHLLGQMSNLRFHPSKLQSCHLSRWAFSSNGHRSVNGGDRQVLVTLMTPGHEFLRHARETQ
jgi:hypothetical protein